MASMPLENIAEVVLTPTGDVPDSVGTRTIPITRKEPLVIVGRSSRNKTKNLQPGHDNAYFDSPVMSRLHSWIKCDEGGKVCCALEPRLARFPHNSGTAYHHYLLIQPKISIYPTDTALYHWPSILVLSSHSLLTYKLFQVLISDAGSMHGTYLDNQLLEPKLFVPLETGSQVRFGNSVTRGSDVFPPKAFDVKVVQNSRMAEIQHGYGITSDELILPDSPYYSSEEEEEEEDEVMITRINPINTVDLTSGSDHGSDWEEDTAQNRVPGHWDESEWSEKPKARGCQWPGTNWAGEPPLQPITVVRETLREHVCIDLDPPPIVRETHVVDLTAETPIPQQSKLPGARISIPDLLAQERQEQSRRSSQTPICNHSYSSEDDAMSSVDGESDTQSVEDYEDSMDEDSTSDPEVTPESAPTSPFSPESIKTSTNLPALSSVQSPMPTLVNEIVPPEVQKAWNSTWTAAPYLSPFVYAGGTPSASDTMEQVRKAEAMRDRAQEFLRSRIEMQSSHSLQTPKEPETNTSTQNVPADEETAKPNPAIPFWVRNFGQGAKVENCGEPDAEKRLAEENLTFKRGTDVPECISTHSKSRSPSPVLKMAGNFQVSDDENEEDEEGGNEQRQQQGKRSFYSDNDSISSGGDEEGYSSPNNSIGNRYESESVSDDDDEEEEEEDLRNIISHILGDEYEEDEEDEEEEEEEEEEEVDLDEMIMEFCGDEGHDTESDSSDDDIAENPTKDIEMTTVQNAVKSAMSMENFFSPKDEEEVRSSQEDEIVKRWNAEVDDLLSTQPDLEIEEPKDAADTTMVDPDTDILPASKKRKRLESEEDEECPHYTVASELEALEISTPRKIAPLPQRFLTRGGQDAGSAETQSPREEAERKELLALASELKNELEAAEPEAKRPRVQNAGATWGSTIATAMAGALIGGVGVFAALVATAGDI
ncbi:hypothetical protein TWF970_008681 [Orbilia oligospora]|uniref:Uncharacterized protein n=1 Tax=Orbilia oligospora TaxID=2813651 RepID=A0A7C8RH21_ORBOL|nr:hypothetical protein TWF970_008681 [Orbilia oligospora]